jgi:hypothetical protein
MAKRHLMRGLTFGNRMENSDQARRIAPRTRIPVLWGLSVALLAASLIGCPGVQISHNADSAASGSVTTVNPAPAPAPSATAPATPAAVPAKAPSTGSAMLSWQAPTENEDGTPIEALAGYRIHFGFSVEALNQLIDVSDAAATTYQINGLTSGTYYFAVSAYNAFDIEGPLSNVGSKSF